MCIGNSVQEQHPVGPEFHFNGPSTWACYMPARFCENIPSKRSVRRFSNAETMTIDYVNRIYRNINRKKDLRDPSPIEFILPIIAQVIRNPLAGHVNKECLYV